MGGLGISPSIPRTVLSHLPERVKPPLRRVRKALRDLPYAGEGRWCPICEGSSRRFRSTGTPPREEALYIHCGALERHRLVWLYWEKRTDLFDGRAKKVLHVSPEPCIESRLRRRLVGEYVTADLWNPNAMVRMDITDIPYPDETFDVIYCSHVLEHVLDDQTAMREFHRVLKKSGWAVLQVPVTADRTLEDPSVVDSRQRLRLFGQEDHVRAYGPDFVERLEGAGFKVLVTRVADLFDEHAVLRMGLTPAAGEVYHCGRG